MKKVSVLMMTYNSEMTLPYTLSSIARQDYDNIEVVISDGGSSDRTLSIIEGFKDRLDIKLVSEPDNGLYDALNRSIRRSSGDYLIVANDQYIDNSAISKLVSALESGDYDGAHADLIYATDEKVIRCWHMGEGRIEGGWLPGHPALLLKKEIYDSYGLYREDMKIASDYEFMVRILKDHSVRLAYVPEILVRMFYGGVSTRGARGYKASMMEGVKALTVNGVRHAWFITFLRTCRVCSQFIFKAKAQSIWYDRKKGYNSALSQR